MKKLKQITNKTTFEEWYEIFNYNKKIIGKISVRLDVYNDFIKILCIFPLRDKKLKYFLSLTSEAKTGYMSKYIMSIANKLGVSKAMINLYFRIKKKSKIYKKIKPTTEEVGDLLNSNMKKFLYKYKDVVKEEIYTEELSLMTIKMCSAIFQQFDKINKQMIKEQ